MPEENRLEQDRAVLESVENKRAGAKLGAYLRLSGPGWLQSAITLGGGSLAGGMYLGVLSGYGMMWLQPLAMLLGVAMLASIAYVTLSTGRRPFRLVVEEVNPVLGWGWAIATLMANIVWCLPQFALGAAAMRQNLMPDLLGDQGAGANGLVIAVGILAALAIATIVSYERGGKGLALFETILKALVAVIVLSFVGVVVQLTMAEDGLNWSRVLAGFLPSLNSLTQPPAAFQGAIALAGESASSFWNGLILGNQRDVMLTAAATAVGINMTFLLPNSLLDRGWDRQFRGLAVFDLGVGLFVPFLIATSCVVMASAARFHGQYNAELVAAAPTAEATTAAGGPANSKAYLGLLDKRLKHEFKSEFDGWSEEELVARRAALTEGDRQLAAMLVKRDASDLAGALEPLTGRRFAQLVFGGGVLAMALSTIIVLMLINGYVFSELFNQPRRGAVHLAGAMLPLLVGVLGPFYWKEASFWLAVPTSVFGIMLLPIAYGAFFFLMNNKRLLGDSMPSGGKRFAINGVLLLGVVLATVGAGWSIWARTAPFPGTGVPTRWVAVGAVALFVALALVFSKKADAEA